MPSIRIIFALGWMIAVFLIVTIVIYFVAGLVAPSGVALEIASLIALVPAARVLRTNLRKPRAVIFKPAFNLALGLAVAGALAWLRFGGMPAVASDAIANADQYELLSIDPGRSQSGLHGHAILGTTTVTDSAVRRRLNRALQFGCRMSDGTANACFSPRHAIRATYDGVTTDLLICFECHRVEVWRGDQKVASFTVTDFPQTAFNAVLKDAGVPLAPKDE